MDSNCRKLGETPYRECRKQAAIYNDALGSMERAAEMLGVSVNTLSNYELGVTVPPVDIIIVMADLYVYRIHVIADAQMLQNQSRYVYVLNVTKGSMKEISIWKV